jgi:hypothetical protein
MFLRNSSFKKTKIKINNTLNFALLSSGEFVEHWRLGAEDKGEYKDLETLFVDYVRSCISVIRIMMQHIKDDFPLFPGIRGLWL